MAVSNPRGTGNSRVELLHRIEQEHPPISLESVDFTVHDPAALRDRYGFVLDYLARVELEVDRNVLELLTLLPDAPETDRRFYADIWQPQEIQHGRILDHLQTLLGRPAAVPDTLTVSPAIRLLGALAHIPSIQDVARLLYYLTGAATERSAVLAYNRLYDGALELGERAVASTVVAPIRRQEPAHFAFYRMSATDLVAQLRPWQMWLTRRLRRLSFKPVGANNSEQLADFGGVAVSLGFADQIDTFAAQVSRVERDLLWANREGLRVPDYVFRAMHEAVEFHYARSGTTDR